MKSGTCLATLLLLFAVCCTGWAQADLIFADGFESGNTDAWANAVGLQLPPIIDLRGDTNRNGIVEMDEPSEDLDEEIWSSSHGAIFLANLDDDQSACPTTGDDAALAACNDAADSIVNGPDDLLDMARLKVAPWPSAPDDSGATIVVSAPGASFVRFFRWAGAGFDLFDPTADALSPEDLRDGVELAIEAVDIVRNPATWDGYLDVTLDVEAGTGEYGPLEDGEDTVRLRVAPVLFRHHIDPPETMYVSAFHEQGSVDFRADLQTAASAAGLPPLYEFWDIGDRWTQDFFETSIMAMPAVAGAHTIHLNFRSANFSSGGLRQAGRVVFTELRGPDVGGAVQYDPGHPDTMDSLNSFGNLETLPPYSHAGFNWPLGRVVRGGTPSYYPDPTFDELIDAQGVQPVIHFDTAWLVVGHIDETINFLPASSPRGWLVLAADTTAAWNALVTAQAAGHGDAPMFVGLLDPWGNPAEITIDAVLADPDLANANTWAAAEVAGQLDQLTLETGLDPSEILSGAFLMFEYFGQLVAYVPGVVNGVVLPNGVYGPPDTHGPEIGGTDLFKDLLEDELAPAGYTVSWVEDWDFYHLGAGEVHCGSNATHAVPAQPWWESLP